MKKLGMILVILMSKRNIFYKKALFLSVFFFIIFSNNSLSQSSSHTIEYEVNENNPLRYEKDQAELYAAIMTIDNFDDFYINDDRIIKKKKLVENYYFKFLK